MGKQVTTYRQLAEKLKELTNEQLNTLITVEDGYEKKSFPADFRICDKDHAFLNDGHPVFYF